MKKKIAFSIILASSFSFAMAQDITKENKAVQVELNKSSKNDIINIKPIIVKDGVVKEETYRKGERPVTNQMTVKIVGEPAPVKKINKN